MFGDYSNFYVAMTASDIGCIDDAYSGVYAGATSYQTWPTNLSPTAGFNPITHGSAKDIIYSLYESVMLKDTDKSVNLHAINDKTYREWLYNKFAGGAVTIASKKEYAGCYKIGSLMEGKKGPLVESITYASVAQALENNIGKSNAISTAKTLKCNLDIASLNHYGGIMIISPTYSTVNYTVTAKGYGDDITYKTTPSGQKLPVYKEAFDGSSNKVTLNVQTRLKMDNEVTDPAQPKGTRWVDDVLIAEPQNYNDTNEVPVYDSVIDDVRQIRPISAETTQAYIPAVTKSNVVLYYADENGEPLSNYTQVNGSQGNQNSAIITKDESTGQPYKLFLDNVNYYAFNPQTNEPKTYEMSVSNNTSSDRMADTRVAEAHNTFSDYTEGETNWVNITIPPIESRPQNARYILVKATVNLGATQKHSDNSTLSEVVSQSRPQQHLDTMGNIVNEYALAYSKDNLSPEAAKAIGTTESILQQNDNQVEILIPISPEYDLSADSISISHKMSEPAPNGSTSLVGIENIKTTSTATDKTKEDFAGKETGEVLYLYATTDSNKAEAIFDYFNDKRDNSDIASTNITNFDPTNGGQYSSDLIKSFTTKKFISPMVTATESAVPSIFNILT